MNKIEQMLQNNFKMFLAGKIDENIFEKNWIFLNRMRGNK